MWIVMMWLAVVGICVSFIPQHPSAAHEPHYASSAQRTHTELIVPALAATVDDVHIVVNAQYRLPADYVPEDLVRPNVPFVTPGNPPKNTLRRIAAQALERLVTAARAEGHTIVGVSAYRSYATQQALYKRALKRKKTAYVAPPGASEHQTGLAIDVSSPSIGYALTEAFGDTPEGIWLAANAADYGFIIRYQSDTQAITHYAYEPWHLRYVGLTLATHAMNTPLETILRLALLE
ncbi:MAG: M15 family metallopeptidase [Paenibacillaceae bacterium]|nr:M15 family metallopeptidase [Paenibacillaceae bacterium]